MRVGQMREAEHLSGLSDGGNPVKRRHRTPTAGGTRVSGH